MHMLSCLSFCVHASVTMSVAYSLHVCATCRSPTSNFRCLSLLSVSPDFLSRFCCYHRIADRFLCLEIISVINVDGLIIWTSGSGLCLGLLWHRSFRVPTIRCDIRMWSAVTCIHIHIHTYIYIYIYLYIYMFTIYACIHFMYSCILFYILYILYCSTDGFTVTYMLCL